MKQNVDRNYTVWILGVLIFLALLFILSIGPRGFIQQIRVSQEKRKLEQEIQSLEVKKEELQEELEKLDDPEYVEKIAREKYGMAKKNEKVYRVVPKEE